jgi:L-serine dehydratase
MKDAVRTGLEEDYDLPFGMVNNGAKKVYKAKTILSPEFQKLVARALAAKEVNSCMGRIVAAPTAGAPVFCQVYLPLSRKYTTCPDQTILEGLLVAAGIALIIEQNASLAGAVGGCQAETGSAAAMGSGAIVYCLGGSIEEVFAAVAITIQCMLGSGLRPGSRTGRGTVYCTQCQWSRYCIFFCSDSFSRRKPVIPVDECVMALGEIGQSMETRYKETAQGGLATTLTGQAISKKVLIQDIEILPDEELE